MKEFNCIVCPNGCLLHVEEENGAITVTGNNCPNGEKFAVSEMTCPMRTLCSTVKTVFPETPVLPVKVSAEIPKEKLTEVMREIDRVLITERIGRGGVIIENVLGLGADVISTSNILMQTEYIHI